MKLDFNFENSAVFKKSRFSKNDGVSIYINKITTNL